MDEDCETTPVDHHQEPLDNNAQRIEKDVETLYRENALLRDKIDVLLERVEALESAASQHVAGGLQSSTSLSPHNAHQHSSGDAHAAPMQSLSTGRKAVSSTTPITKRFIKAGASMRSKLQQHPAFSKTIGNADLRPVKTGVHVVSCQLLSTYMGHTDGLWEVYACSSRSGLLGTASADRTAGIFDIFSGSMLQQYVGHAGSVNSIRFAESTQSGELWALTASGDQTAHLWCVSTKSLPVQVVSKSSMQNIAEGDQPDATVPSTSVSESSDLLPPLATAVGGDDAIDVGDSVHDGSRNRVGGTLPTTVTTRDALRKFRTHSAVVSCADFLAGAPEFVVTASWDRTACLQDVSTGEQVSCLSGHDDEVTHVSSHRHQRLFATSSRDSTLRLWDFRDAVHSVSVFQGHTDTVTSTVFSSASDGNIVVSGSDDHTVKTWDLRNMRSAISVARFKSGVNRLSVNKHQVGVPLDNGQIYLLDLNSGKLIRLPLLSKFKQAGSHAVQRASGSAGHHGNTAADRIVTSVAWLETAPSSQQTAATRRPRSGRAQHQQQNLTTTVAGETTVKIDASDSVEPMSGAQQQQAMRPPTTGGEVAKSTTQFSGISAANPLPECNFFSSNFERGVAYGWRIDNLSGVS